MPAGLNFVVAAGVAGHRKGRKVDLGDNQMVAVCVPDLEMGEGSDFRLGTAVERDINRWGSG